MAPTELFIYSIGIHSHRCLSPDQSELVADCTTGLFYLEEILIEYSS